MQGISTKPHFLGCDSSQEQCAQRKGLDQMTFSGSFQPAVGSLGD